MRTEPRKTNGSTIGRLRLEHGLTQRQLADKIGCQQKDVSRWEHGGRNPGAASLVKLAAALGCTIDELLAPAPSDPPPHDQ